METRKINLRAALRTKYRARPEESVPVEHTHRFYQMVAVAEGNAVITLRGERLAVSAGDVFFIPPSLPLSLRPVEGEITTHEVRLDIAGELAALLAGVPAKIEIEPERVFDLLRFVVEEANARRPYYRELTTLSVESTLYLLARAYSPKLGEGLPLVSRVEGAPSGIEQVRDYLEGNIDERITLATLAARFSLTREHLCRTFTAAYGVSPIHYLNERRQECACRLLRETDKSVTEIAAATGFSSIHYFSRAFSASAGVSPYEYRRRHRAGTLEESTEK